RAVSRAIVRHHDFSAQSRRAKRRDRFFYANADGIRFIQAGDDHRHFGDAVARLECFIRDLLRRCGGRPPPPPPPPPSHLLSLSLFFSFPFPPLRPSPLPFLLFPPPPLSWRTSSRSDTHARNHVVS